jgi:hypothetical protein
LGRVQMSGDGMMEIVVGEISDCRSASCEFRVGVLPA